MKMWPRSCFFFGTLGLTEWERMISVFRGGVCILDLRTEEGDAESVQHFDNEGERAKGG